MSEKILEILESIVQTGNIIDIVEKHEDSWYKSSRYKKALDDGRVEFELVFHSKHLFLELPKNVGSIGNIHLTKVNQVILDISSFLKSLLNEHFKRNPFG